MSRWLLLLALLNACSDDDGGGGPIVPLVDLERPDEARYDVKSYKAGVVVMPRAEAADHLVETDAEAGRLVFDGAASKVAALAAGDLAMIEGVGPVRVTSVNTAGGNVELVAELAKLTDVIEEGELSWDQRFFTGQSDALIGVGVGSVVQPLSGSYNNGKLTFSGKISGWDVTFSLTPAGSGYDVDGSASRKEGAATINVKGKGKLTGFRSAGAVTISGGSTQDFTFRHEGLQADLDLELGGVEASTSAKVSVPARISLPFTIGYIPATVGVGGSLEIESTLKGKTSAIARARLRFGGDVGFQLEGGKLVPVGSLDSASLSYQGGEHVGTIDAGVGFLFAFPRVDFSMGILATGPEAYIKIKNEVVSNFLLRYEAAGPVPVITGNCLRASVNIGAYVGGSFKVLGFTLVEKETPLYTKVMPRHEEGDACDEL